jgi:hypothetical protein
MRIAQNALAWEGEGAISANSMENQRSSGGGIVQLRDAAIRCGGNPSAIQQIMRSCYDTGLLPRDNYGRTRGAVIDGWWAGAFAIACTIPVTRREVPTKVRQAARLRLVTRRKVTTIRRQVGDTLLPVGEEHTVVHVDPNEGYADFLHQLAVLIEWSATNGRARTEGELGGFEVAASLSDARILWASGSAHVYEPPPGTRITIPQHHRWAAFETVGRANAAFIAELGEVVAANRREAERLGISISSDELLRELGYEAPASLESVLWSDTE